MNEILYCIFHYGPYFLVGFVVWFVMKTKYANEIRIATLEAYQKGQEDYREMIPEKEEHLKKLSQEYSDAFNKDWSSHKKEYRIGLIDGSKYVYENMHLGEYTTSDAVSVLKGTKYTPARSMHWSQSDYYDEIIEEYLFETGYKD